MQGAASRLERLRSLPNLNYRNTPAAELLTTDERKMVKTLRPLDWTETTNDHRQAQYHSTSSTKPVRQYLMTRLLGA